MIKIIKDVDLIDHIQDYDVILLYADIFSTMCNGLAFDIKKKYHYVLETNISTKYGDISKLGTIIESKKENKPTFCLCYINKDIFVQKKFLLNDTCQYDAIEKCLKLINIKYKNKHIASTILGSSPFDGNGNKEKILSIFENTLTNVDIELYDYEQMHRSKKWWTQYIEGKKILEQSGYTAYTEYIKNKKQK